MVAGHDFYPISIADPPGEPGPSRAVRLDAYRRWATRWWERYRVDFWVAETSNLGLAVAEQTAWLDEFLAGLDAMRADGLPVRGLCWYSRGDQFDWQTGLVEMLGVGFSPDDWLACVVHGGAYYIPVLLVTFAAGGLWEALFATVRGHEVNEGFLVTGMLFPLILPPTVPLWQVALGVSFGVVVGKEIFGGTGMNVLNPALVGRAFLFFAYPAALSGDSVWTAAQTSADGVSGATVLAQATLGGTAAVTAAIDPWDAFVGWIPGSMGETSVLACLMGAVILVMSGVGSWRIMLSLTAGTLATALLLNGVGSATNPFFDLSPAWHFLVGGWAFGTVYMATDPVSAPSALGGQYVYGFLIGALVVLIRVVNPAYPEGMMLAILFMNLFAPLIDYFAVQANIRRRSARYAR